MILVDNEILDRIKNYENYNEVFYKRECKPLIKNFDEENLQSVAYDIRITNKIKKFKNKFITMNLSNSDDIDNCMEEEDITKGYLLRPGEYILVQLAEYLNMPDDLVAYLQPRTSFIKIGLVISFQYINPSYSGQLQIGLYNATPNAIKIVPNLKLGQMIFEKLSKQINKENLYFIKKNSEDYRSNEFKSSEEYQEFQKKLNNEYNNLIKIIRK